LLGLPKEGVKYTGCFWNRRQYFRNVLYRPKQRQNFIQTCAS